ncbi:MAG: D-alanyl-D-alanine carboxypeptidase [Acidobacteriota bacterium]|nr:D-alanyl-D-alanine carboxypeptidase [Acidobacteriota bacterium]
MALLAGGVASAQAAPPRHTKTTSKTAYSRARAASRRARLARARAEARAREMAEAVVPRYRVDANGNLVPEVRAAAAIIYDPVSGQVLFQENANDQRSIASITKVMTAVVFLESHPDMDAQVKVLPKDVYRASTTYLRSRDVVTVDDLLHLLLIPSDNAAARVLARISPEGAEGFVERMNQKAAELGLENTHYADPSGLDARNVSSAYDMARLITYASQINQIASIMRLPEYTFRTSRRTITIHSTDHLLRRSDVDVRAAKTGFISKAGFCLATLLRLPQSGRDVAVVVLGARSNAGRFTEARNLFAWFSSRASELLGTSAQNQNQNQDQNQ